LTQGDMLGSTLKLHSLKPIKSAPHPRSGLTVQTAKAILLKQGTTTIQPAALEHYQAEIAAQKGIIHRQAMLIAQQAAELRLALHSGDSTDNIGKRAAQAIVLRSQPAARAPQASVTALPRDPPHLPLPLSLPVVFKRILPNRADPAPIPHAADQSAATPHTPRSRASASPLSAPAVARHHSARLPPPQGRVRAALPPSTSPTLLPFRNSTTGCSPTLVAPSATNPTRARALASSAPLRMPQPSPPPPLAPIPHR
jgi:hypothetical protein